MKYQKKTNQAPRKFSNHSQPHTQMNQKKTHFISVAHSKRKSTIRHMHTTDTCTPPTMRTRTLAHGRSINRADGATVIKGRGRFPAVFSTYVGPPVAFSLGRIFVVRVFFAVSPRIRRQIVARKLAIRALGWAGVTGRFFRDLGPFPLFDLFVSVCLCNFVFFQCWFFVVCFRTACWLLSWNFWIWTSLFDSDYVNF